MGSAAFNIGGITCHSAFHVNVREPSKSIAGTTHEDALKEKLLRMLLLIIDERSMLSMDVMGAIERNITSCIYNGHMTHVEFGAIPIILLFGDDHQLPSIVQNKIGYGTEYVFDENQKASSYLNAHQRHGRQCLLDLSKKVVILQNVRRIDDDGQDLRDICANIRKNGAVTAEQDKQLKALHIDYGNVSETRKDYLKKNALWVYPTTAAVDAHNFEEMRKLVHKDNPLIRLPCKMYGRSRQSAVRSHFDVSLRTQSNPVLCRGCRVTLDRNYCESIGLFNGSTGTVQEIRYRPGTSPLRGDFPAYVLIDVDTYNGVPWNLHYPKFVPIYPLKVFCRKGCCILEYFPISLAFAKTIHKIQGKEFGPRFKNLPALVADIGQRVLESMFLGITYVILSRVSNIGNGNPDNSVLYFSGPMFEENRFTDLTHKTNSSTLYKRYEDRLRWISHIEEVALRTDITIADEEKDDLENWARHTTISADECGTLISVYCSKLLAP
jgi:hypothetical protein